MDSNPSKKKILLIDDNQDILDILTDCLVAGGYEVVTAADGHQGLQGVEQHGPDLIVVDLSMPGLDGWRFCQRLRQDDKFAPYQRIPIIVLSALVENEGPAGKLELADFYFAKPFDTIKLKSKVRELLKEA